jgi:hypothetical protein
MNDRNIGYSAHGVGPLSPPDPDGVECKHCELEFMHEELTFGACWECIREYHCIGCEADEELDQYGLCKPCSDTSDTWAVRVVYWGVIHHHKGEEDDEVLQFVDPSEAGTTVELIPGTYHKEVLRSAVRYLTDKYHEFKVTHIGELTPVEDLR